MSTSPPQATIMVVDDNPSNLKLLIDILLDHGYAVRAFPDGQLALQAADHNIPDLILLDINMPGLNGFEVCKALKARPLLKDVPIIFISALNDTREKVKAFEYGGVDYITKPFEQEEIRARVQTHLKLIQAEALQREVDKRIRLERQYYSQLENLSDAIIHADRAGRIVYCNPVTERYFGYSSTELLGNNIEILIPEGPRAIHKQHQTDYLSKPSIRYMSEARQIFARKKSGETFPVEISLSTLYSEAGLLVSAEIRDISDQAQLRREYDVQLRLFNDAFSKSNDGMLLTDAAGNIMRFSPSVCKMLGYQADELSGRPLENLYYTESDHAKVAALIKQQTDHTEKVIHVDYKCKDGTALPSVTTLIKVKDDVADRDGHFFVIRDISEQAKMEQERKLLLKQLSQAQKMEALGQLTGGIAHDFNNILASILGFTELGQQFIKEQRQPAAALMPKLLGYYDEIHAAGERASKLIAQMLTFSRHGKQEALKPFDIRILIDEATKMLRPVLPSTIAIRTYVAEKTPMVLADPVQVHQVLVNICINAKDAMENRGRIQISLQPHRCQDTICTSCLQAIAGDYLELSITDTGSGISESTMEHLFEPFFTTKQIGKGTGMGLAMVHGIMHHHQGHIVVQSEPGRGSTFRLLFPLINADHGTALENSPSKVKNQVPA